MTRLQLQLHRGSWKMLMYSLVRPRNTCDWEWTEWSSCSSFCNLDGSMPEDAPTKRKREKVPRWIKVPKKLCRGEPEEMCTPTPCKGKARGFTYLWHTPLSVFTYRLSNHPEPFVFGDWTTTPGGRRPFCNDTCGSYRNYWEMRSCGPAHPNLPEGQSCENLDESLTLRNSTVACVPFVPCKGDSL